MILFKCSPLGFFSGKMTTLLLHSKYSSKGNSRWFGICLQEFIICLKTTKLNLLVELHIVLAHVRWSPDTYIAQRC